VCKLVKGLQGLKQAPRTRNKKLEEMEVQPLKNDCCQ